MYQICPIFLLGIYVCKGNAYLVDGNVRYARIPGNDNKIPLSSDITSVKEHVSSLSECGIKCSGEFGCCYFFYSSSSRRCLTASGVKDSVLVSSSGFRQYSIHGADIPEGQCFEDSVYTIGLTQLTWDDAKAACLNMDANLVEIDKWEENTFLQILSRNFIKETSWIGATDSRLEETWQWTDSNDTFSFTAWGEKQPNNYHNQDCLTLFDEFDYLWADEHCTNNLYKYTCEKTIE